MGRFGHDDKQEARATWAGDHDRYSDGAGRVCGLLGLHLFQTPEARQTISIIAETLRSFPALCVRIAGHTNSTGDAQANRTLSRLRAMAIGAQLTRVDPTAFPKQRFDIQGHGSEQPVLVDGQEDKAASRRTEFTLYTCGEGA